MSDSIEEFWPSSRAVRAPLTMTPPRERSAVQDSSGRFESFVGRGLVAIRWLRPDPIGSRGLVELVREAHSDQGRPLLLLVVIGRECSTPDAHTRQILSRDHDRVANRLLASRVLILGSGFRQSVMRSILTSLTLVTSWGARFVVDRSIDDFAEATRSLIGLRRELLIDDLLAARVLLPDEVLTAG